MSVSDSDQESMNNNSSKEGEVRKLGSGELCNLSNNRSNKKLKQHKESFLNLDANYNYESSRSRLVSQPKSNKNYYIFYVGRFSPYYLR